MRGKMTEKLKYVCPKCGGTDLTSKSTETLIFVHHILNDDFVSEKRIPVEHHDWILICRNPICGHEFPEDEL